LLLTAYSGLSFLGRSRPGGQAFADGAHEVGGDLGGPVAGLGDAVEVLGDLLPGDGLWVALLA
jgi:hypothetical protein